MSKSPPKTLKRPRNYLSRREQWRLLLMVGSLGLVAVLMMEAAKPENWHWLWGEAPAEGISETVPQRAADAPPIDSRLLPKPPSNDPPGTFHSPGPAKHNAEKAAGDYFRGVEPEHLGAIRDDTTFRYDERHAWFNLLGILQETSEKELEKASLGRVTYFQLFEQTNEYRGRLVTIRGRIRRAMPAGVPKNDLGLEQYHQLIVQPDDALEEPIVVYALGLPEGFPTGMKIEQRAEITGFYFKRWPYLAQDGLRTAPTLAAKTIRWIRAAPEGADSQGPGSVVVVVAVAALIALLVTYYIYMLTRHKVPSTPTAAPQLDGLKELEGGDGRDRLPSGSPEGPNEE